MWRPYGSHIDNVKRLLDLVYFADVTDFQQTEYQCIWSKLHPGKPLLAVVAGAGNFTDFIEQSGRLIEGDGPDLLLTTPRSRQRLQPSWTTLRATSWTSPRMEARRPKTRGLRRWSPRPNLEDNPSKFLAKFLAKLPREDKAPQPSQSWLPVSYTHLTLPTILRV